MFKKSFEIVFSAESYKSIVFKKNDFLKKFDKKIGFYLEKTCFLSTPGMVHGNVLFFFAFFLCNFFDASKKSPIMIRKNPRSWSQKIPRVDDFGRSMIMSNIEAPGLKLHQSTQLTERSSVSIVSGLNSTYLGTNGWGAPPPRPPGYRRREIPATADGRYLLPHKGDTCYRIFPSRTPL